MIKVTAGQSIYEVEEGTTLEQLAKQLQKRGTSDPSRLHGWETNRVIYRDQKRLSCTFCYIERTSRIYGV